MYRVNLSRVLAGLQTRRQVTIEGTDEIPPFFDRVPLTRSPFSPATQQRLGTLQLLTQKVLDKPVPTC
jgi:hypothetical protein